MNSQSFDEKAGQENLPGFCAEKKLAVPSYWKTGLAPCARSTGSMNQRLSGEIERRNLQFS